MTLSALIFIFFSASRIGLIGPRVPLSLKCPLDAVGFIGLSDEIGMLPRSGQILSSLHSDLSRPNATAEGGGKILRPNREYSVQLSRLAVQFPAKTS